MLYDIVPRQQGSWGQHGAHLVPVSPSWAPCWPHKLCYQGSVKQNIWNPCTQESCSHTTLYNTTQCGPTVIQVVCPKPLAGDIQQLACEDIIWHIFCESIICGLFCNWHSMCNIVLQLAMLWWDPSVHTYMKSFYHSLLPFFTKQAVGIAICSICKAYRIPPVDFFDNCNDEWCYAILFLFKIK